MAWCIGPKLATLSNIPVGLSSSRLHSSWPSEPGAYDLTHQIGKGSTALVYHALCKTLHKAVAVKKLNLDNHGDLGALVREAALLRRFQHRHVLLLCTSFVVGRELWLVMPFMDLGSVRTIMCKAFPQGLDEVLIATIMKSTLEALDYVHRNGGIHRDIKADNILINSSGEVRLADFGVAFDRSSSMSFLLRRLASSSGSSGGGSGRSDSSGSGYSRLGAAAGNRSAAALLASRLVLRTNTFVGTPCWMAPEVMQQLEEGYSEAVDVWSVGITLIELATGKPPLARCNPMRILVDTLNSPPPSLPPDGSSSRRYSKALRDLVALCLQKDPNKRPTAAELLQHKFFKSARDATYLATTLTQALTAAQQQQPAAGAGPAAAAAGRAKSSPGSAGLLFPAGRLRSATLNAAASRKVQSEPLMARLRSVLGLGVPGVNLGPVVSQGPFQGGPACPAVTGGNRSGWSASALGLRGAASDSRAGVGAAGSLSAAVSFAPAGAADTAGLASSAATTEPAAAAAGSAAGPAAAEEFRAFKPLSRKGSPGLKGFGF